MKKWLVLFVIVLMAITSTALAAPTSFDDVPAKHWAYEAVGKLAKTGIIEGYEDGTFRGDRTMTRYEFAVIIGKALDRYSTAGAIDKELLNKLSAEFATELNTLGVRVKKVENKIGTFKLNGDMRVRYEAVNNPQDINSWPGGVGTRVAKSLVRDRYRLMITNEVAPNVSVFGLLNFSGTGSGATNTSNYDNNNTDGGFPTNPNNISGTAEALFVTYKAPDGSVYKAGRNFLFLGQGMLWDVPHADGFQATFGNKLRTMVGMQQFIGRTWYFTDMKYNLNQDLQLTAAYIRDTDKIWYNSTAVGFVYKGIPNWKISSEVGQNDHAKVNVDHNRSGNINAGIVRAKYGEAKRDKVGSNGVWVSYKKAEKGFDTQFASTWNYVSPYPSGMADDLKGFEYGFEYTVFKNGTLEVIYDPLKSYDGSRDLKFLIAQLTTRF